MSLRKAHEEGNVNHAPFKVVGPPKRDIGAVNAVPKWSRDGRNP